MLTQIGSMLRPDHFSYHLGGFSSSPLITLNETQTNKGPQLNLDPISTSTANIIGAFNALFAFGAAMGAIAQGWISDWCGCRTGLAIAASCAFAGGALAAGSAAIAMLMVVRILQGFELGAIISLVLLYLIEVAPPNRRGFLPG